jgi:hypothetical protein
LRFSVNISLLVQFKKKMDKLRNDFNAFKEQQTDLNRSVMERLDTLETQNHNSARRLNDNTDVLQERSIPEKLISFDARIQRLENQNPVNKKVKFF